MNFPAKITPFSLLSQASRIYRKLPKAKIALITCCAVGVLLLMADEIRCRQNSTEEETDQRVWTKLQNVFFIYCWLAHSKN